MFPAMAIRTSDGRDEPVARPRSPQTADAEAIEARTRSTRNVSANRTASAGGEPERTADAVEQREIAAVGVEAVEGPDERVVGVEPGVLLVEQEREPIRLVALAAPVAAEGQEEAEQGRDRRPNGERAPKLRPDPAWRTAPDPWDAARRAGGSRRAAGVWPGRADPVNVSSRLGPGQGLAVGRSVESAGTVEPGDRGWRFASGFSGSPSSLAPAGLISPIFWIWLTNRCTGGADQIWAAGW